MENKLRKFITFLLPTNNSFLVHERTYRTYMLRLKKKCQNMTTKLEKIKRKNK